MDLSNESNDLVKIKHIIYITIAIGIATQKFKLAKTKITPKINPEIAIFIISYSKDISGLYLPFKIIYVIIEQTSTPVITVVILAPI